MPPRAAYFGSFLFFSRLITQVHSVCPVHPLNPNTWHWHPSYHCVLTQRIKSPVPDDIRSFLKQIAEVRTLSTGHTRFPQSHSVHQFTQTPRPYCKLSYFPSLLHGWTPFTQPYTLYIKIQFGPHRENSVFPLGRSTGKCCIGGSGYLCKSHGAHSLKHTERIQRWGSGVKTTVTDTNHWAFIVEDTTSHRKWAKNPWNHHKELKIGNAPNW